MAAKTDQLHQIVERMGSTDKDLRYMAVSDLMTDTERGDLVLDDEGERKICRHLLKLLVDKSSEVQNIVVRAVGHMTPRFSRKESLLFLAISLIEMIATSGEEIYCTALKAVVGQLSPANGGEEINQAVKDLYPKIVNLMDKSSENLALELMDICSDLLLRYGNKLGSHHEHSLTVITKWVLQGRSMIRKRATQALGSLATCCTQQLFQKTVGLILEWLDSKPSDQLKVRNYVMAANYVCRSRGSQFSLYLSELLPKLKLICDDTEDEDNREAVLTTMETLLFYCGGNIAEHQAEIQKTLIKYLSHDPNYCVGDEDEAMDAEAAEWEDGDDGQYSDTDDDLSWKVRKACAKALATEVKYLDNSGKKLLGWMTVVAPKLVDRLCDREDHVLLEVVHALREMALQCSKFLPDQGEQNVDSFGDLTGEAEASADQMAVMQELENLQPRIIRGVTNLIGKKQTITRAACFELLIVLTQALPNKLSSGFLLGAALAGLEDKTGGSQIKMLTLQFITAALKSHEPSVCLEATPQLTEMLVKAVDDNFYKIVSEAVLVLGRFATVLQKAREVDASAAAGHIDKVYTLLQSLLQKTHGDQEVLHRSINTTGVYLNLLADQSNANEPELLRLLADTAERNFVDQNMTITALLALKAVAENEKAEPMFAAQIERILGNLAMLMEKNCSEDGERSKGSRDNVVDVQNTVLDLAMTIFSTQKVDPQSASVGRLVVALPTLLKESDLQVAHKALRCMTAVLEMGLFDEKYLPQLIRLFESHLLGGVTLQTAIQTATALAKQLMKTGTSFEEILDALTASVYSRPNLPKQAYKSIAMTTAEIAAATGDKETALKLASQLVGHLQSTNHKERLFSIQALGELGRAFPDVYIDGPLKPEELLSSIFSDANDELRPVAAQSLGAIAAGNPSSYLPFILSRLDAADGAQLPLLHAIKEVLGSGRLEQADVDRIWPVLVAHADVQEEGIRSVVADCVGKLCDRNPKQGLVALQNLLTDKRVNVRYTAVSAFKVIIFDASKIKNRMLVPLLGAIGDAVKDEDTRVRRIGLIVLHGLFLKRTQLMRAYVSEVLPAIYKELKIRKELIHQVQMGPFKHEVDGGVEIRKAAYECMFTILERCAADVDMKEYVKNLENGLKDTNQDIRLLTGMIILRVCQLSPASLLQNVNRFIEPMRVLLQERIKDDAVRQEHEKLEESKRAVIRIIRSIQKIPDADRLLTSLLNMINHEDRLRALSAKIDKEDRENKAMEL